MPGKRQTGFHSDDATLAPRGDGASSPSSPHAVPGPLDGLPVDDGTLAPPPLPQPPDTLPPRPIEETLAPPAPLKETAPYLPETLDPGAQRMPDSSPAPLAPGDATLDPGDPQAQAYQQAVAQQSPFSSSASFGDYQLIEPIAKGGMGIVYKARQRKLNRIVAIKMILSGQFADRTDVERFYAEAEAAAGLSHPNIVAIHEIGEVNGQHFFSMDYIEGNSLSGMVRESTFLPQQAAAMLKTIAETMQFAHERGVVHRDLKPSNVLVDRTNRPLITDFGLAKQVSNQSQLTMSGAIIGTPSYMPPEQATGDGERVGPWSDIYSLGAILYELLTGRPPFRAATPFETIRQVIESEPVSPRLVNPSVPKDLETICLKCLQKEPAKRYATSQELAEELGRFINGEPIKARPIGRVARLWRLCRRYPYTASAVAAFVLVLIVASIGLTIANIRVNWALAKSEASERKSDQSFRAAMKAVNDLFTIASEETLFNQPGMQPVRDELLEKALSFYQGFLEERGDDPTVVDELAATYTRIGHIKQTLGLRHEALPAYQTALAMQEERVEAAPHDPQRLTDYANTLNALGTFVATGHDYPAARDWFLKAAEVRQRLLNREPNSSEYLRLLANTVMNIAIVEKELGDAKAASRYLEESQRLRSLAIERSPNDRRLHRDAAKCAYTLANVHWLSGRIDDAERSFLAAVDALQTLEKSPPMELENQKLLAISLRLLGDLSFKSKQDLEGASKWYGEAIDYLERLARQNPAVPDYRLEQAGPLMHLALVQSAQEKHTDALGSLERAQKILAPLTEQFPDVPQYKHDLGTAIKASAVEHWMLGEYPVAREQMQHAARLFSELNAAYPAHAEFAEQLAGVYVDLAELELQDNQPPAAVEALRQARQVRASLADQFQDVPGYRCDLATALRSLAAAYVLQGKPNDAAPVLNEAKEILDRLTSEFPDDAEFAEQRRLTEQALEELRQPPMERSE